MKVLLARRAKSAAAVLTAALTLSLLPFPVSAQADTAPADPSSPQTPLTVAADPLPTVQIDGVAWTQLIVGNTVYVGGNFTTARPAGAAAGVNTTPRANLLAYDLTTGELITSFVADTNGEVFALTTGKVGDIPVIFAGGSFTNVNGTIRNRIVALNPATGAVVHTFQVGADASVRTIVATDSTVYFGGVFTSVNGVARSRLAAVQAADGALLSWAPTATSTEGVSAQVSTMALSPAGDKLLIGGKFTALNGSSDPGYGLGAVDLNGNSLPWAANAVLRDGGNNAGITSLVNDASDSRYVYLTGYVFGTGGNFEGVSKLNWETGAIEWMADCHGDTYGSYPMAGGDAVYAVSHAHYCGNLPDGFPQTTPWTFYWGTAFSKAATQVLTKDQVGYPNWAGNAAPSLLKWTPRLVSGTFTGQDQAGWTVTGNDQYVVYGGEFPTAGGVGQQGLVRYAVSSIAPNKNGPVVTGARLNPTLTSVRAGEVRISWPANWDRDNEQLTYRLFRDSITAPPIYEATVLSSEWDRPSMGHVDRGLIAGQEYRYRLFVRDAFGNEARSDSVYITPAAADSVSGYAEKVLADGASSYWSLGESAGATAVDLGPSFGNATAQAGVTRGAAGAIAGSADTAATFSGTSTGWATTTSFLTGAPAAFTTEAWVKTTSTSGGKIVGFGSSATGASYTYDRHTYMTGTGQIALGVLSPNLTRLVVTSPQSYNDGAWHHVVSTLGASGLQLYVDGVRVAQRTDVTSAYPYRGFWRIGGDNLLNWTGRGTSDYLAGSIDDVAVYPTALSSTQVTQHYSRANGGDGNLVPTADFASSVNRLAVGFDAAASADADGTITSYAWDFGDGTSDTGVTVNKTYAGAGTYQVKLTVTDNGGATASVTKAVTVAANAAPTAAFTTSVSNLTASFNAAGSRDVDGTISSYAWDFGDGTTGSGATASRTYAAAGTYTVRLTVTDNDGATGVSSQSVTVSTAPVVNRPIASDTFNRSVTGGWGSATSGGAWTRFGSSTSFSVDGSAGRITMSTGGSGPRAVLNSVSTTSSDVTAKLALNKLPSGAAGSSPYNFVGVAGRTVGTDEYRAKVRISNTGATILYLTRLSGGTETTLRTASLGSGLRYSPGSQLQIRVQTYGTSATTIRARVWRVGSVEPTTWNATISDSTASLQRAGGVGLLSYVSSNTTNRPIVASFDDLVVNAGP